MELDHIRRRYAEMDDATLLDDWSHGTAGYAVPEVWQIITAEVTRRDLETPVPLEIPQPEGLEAAAEAYGRRGPGEAAPDRRTHYVILIHPDGSRAAVKRGFCWPAFFLTWIWAFARGLPGWGVGLVVIVAVNVAIGASGAGAVSLLIGGLLRWVIGRKGNRLRERALVAAGFRAIGTVPAETPESALARVQIPVLA